MYKQLNYQYGGLRSAKIPWSSARTCAQPIPSSSTVFARAAGLEARAAILSHVGEVFLILQFKEIIQTWVDIGTFCFRERATHTPNLFESWREMFFLCQNPWAEHNWSIPWIAVEIAKANRSDLVAQKYKAWLFLGESGADQNKLCESPRKVAWIHFCYSI